jgi:hypothetical protein
MKLTDWYTPDIKPLRRGVYITRKNDTIYFQYWTGTFWNVRMSNIDKANKTKQRSQHQDVCWKGILK